MFAPEPVNVMCWSEVPLKCAGYIQQWSFSYIHWGTWLDLAFSIWDCNKLILIAIECLWLINHELTCTWNWKKFLNVGTNQFTNCNQTSMKHIMIMFNFVNYKLWFTCDIEVMQFTDFWLCTDLALIQACVRMKCWMDCETPHCWIFILRGGEPPVSGVSDTSNCENV